MNRKTMRLGTGVALLLVATTWGVGGCSIGLDQEQVGERTEALTGAGVVAWSSPGGLRASQGNLYWTVSSFSELGGGYDAAVYRASKGNTPGNEVVLYSESSPSPVSFGAINYAQGHAVRSDIPAPWFGYFVANYAGISQIKRIPLAGGAATIVATSPTPIGGREALQADHVADIPSSSDMHVYWADATGIRRASIDGGPVKTLAALPNVVGLGLTLSQVFVAAGKGIYNVPKDGGPPKLRVTTEKEITSLHVHAGLGVYGSGLVLAWTELGGAVMTKGVNETLDPQRADDLTRVVFAGASGHDALSVSTVPTDANRFAFTICTTPGSSSCKAYEGKFLTTGSTFESTSAGVGARFIQIDSTQMFWGNAGAIRRTTYAVASPPPPPPPPPPPCISTGNPCAASRCSGTATDNCGTVFECNASCGMDGLCPCRGGQCRSGACVCNTGACN
jgi:hypothetical protein